MKNVKLLVITFVCMALMVSCQSDKAIPVTELPEAAQTFINKTYPINTIVVAKKDTEWFSTKYEATLDNGLKIEFDADGLPLDVDND